MADTVLYQKGLSTHLWQRFLFWFWESVVRSIPWKYLPYKLPSHMRPEEHETSVLIDYQELRRYNSDKNDMVEFMKRDQDEEIKNYLLEKFKEAGMYVQVMPDQPDHQFYAYRLRTVVFIPQELYRYGQSMKKHGGQL